MIHKIYSVRDQAAQAYCAPFIVHNQGLALRAFADACNDDNHHFSKNPQDYIIFELGEFDDNTCHFEINDAPLSLGVGIDFVKRPGVLPGQLDMLNSVSELGNYQPSSLEELEEKNADAIREANQGKN